MIYFDQELKFYKNIALDEFRIDARSSIHDGQLDDFRLLGLDLCSHFREALLEAHLQRLVVAVRDVPLQLLLLCLQLRQFRLQLLHLGSNCRLLNRRRRFRLKGWSRYFNTVFDIIF